MGIAVMLLIAACLALAIVAGYGVGIYNALVRLCVNIDKSWANISVLEKQRYDEIPRLVKICEGYMQYERDTLEKVTAARTSFLSAGTPGAVAKAGSALSGALKTLFAVAENYPQLKADENFRHLQARVSELENQIADRREFYNDSVAIFNTRIKQIPDIFLARMMGYADREMYAVPSTERAAPPIKFDQPD